MGQQPLRNSDRNALCARYDECLNIATRFDSFFSCAPCPRARIEARKETDPFACYLLLAAVFFPGKHRQYRVDRIAADKVSDNSGHAVFVDYDE